MLFSSPPVPLADLVTLPIYRRQSFWPPKLLEVTRAVETCKEAFLSAPSSEKAWKHCQEVLSSINILDTQEWSWGQFFAHALVCEDPEAAQAVLVASKMVFTGVPLNFLDEVTQTLHECGRLDLFRPGLVLFHDFCDELWRQDEPLRFLFYGPSFIRTPTLPTQASWPPATAPLKFGPILFAARGGDLWLQVLQQVPALVKHRTYEDGPQLRDICVLLSDAVASIPSLRPTACLCLVTLGRCAHALSGTCERDLDRGLMLSSPFVRDVLPWVQATSPGEAAAVLRRIAASASLRDFPSRYGDQGADLAQALFTAHPTLGMDDWLRLGVPDEILLPDEDKDVRLSNLCGAILGPRRIDTPGDASGALRSAMVNKYLHCGAKSLTNSAQSIDQLVAWIGPGRGDELQEDTRAILDLLVEQVAVPLPALRSALDKAHLSVPSPPIPGGRIPTPPRPRTL